MVYEVHPVNPATFRPLKSLLPNPRGEGRDEEACKS